MNQMVIGATLQGKPAWFTIENKYDSPGKWELTTSEDDRRPAVYNQDQLKVLIKTLEKIVENMQARGVNGSMSVSKTEDGCSTHSVSVWQCTREHGRAFQPANL